MVTAGSLGHEAREVYESFDLNDTQKNKLDIVLEKFNNHYVPRINVTYERFKFLTRRQLIGEAYEHYMTELKNLSASCELADLRQSLIKDVFICGIQDSTIQQALLRMPTLDVCSVLDYCRTKVVVHKQVETMKEDPKIQIKEEPMVDVLNKYDKKNAIKSIECGYCGYQHQYGKCPAFGKKCSNCNKLNHFAKKFARGFHAGLPFR
ncbi:hypothetical protein ACJJTC_018958 [Scirpophaga incertulas]